LNIQGHRVMMMNPSVLVLEADMAVSTALR